MKLNSFITLLGSSVLGQIILLSFSPILTRIYTPEDFGLFGSTVSSVTILSVFASLRLERALFIIPNLQDLSLLFVLLLAFVIVFSLFLFSFIYIYHDSILHLIPSFSSSSLFLLPLILVGFQSVAVINHRITRDKSFTRLGFTNLVQNLGNITTQLFLGFKGFGVNGLLVGFFVGYLTSILFNLKHIVSKWLPHFTSFSISRISSLLYRYRDFIKFTVPADLINVFTIQSPQLILLALFSPSVSGSYLLADRLTKYPLLLISNAITKYLFAHALEIANPTIFNKRYVALFRILCVFSFIVILPLALLTPIIVPFFLGNDWLYAGIYARNLCPLYISAFVSIPIMSILVIYERQLYDLIFQLFFLLSTLSSFLLSFFLHFSPSHSIFFYSSMASSSYLLGLFLSFRSLNIPVRQYINPMLLDLLTCFLYSIPFYLCSFYLFYQEYSVFLLILSFSSFFFYLIMSFLRLKPLYANIKAMS